MPTAPLNGIEVYYEIHGSGPPVLSISGTGNDLRNSDPASMPLNDSFTVAHYDQRGLGRTSVPDGPYSMADYADDAAALLDHLGWDTTHVVGVSFGGMVAQNLAVRHLDRVQRLVLACTSSGGQGGSSLDLLTLADLPERERAQAGLAALDTRFESVEDLPPDVLELMARHGAQPEPGSDAARGARLQLEARADHDVYDSLPDVTVPTLVIGGRYDGIAPVANLEAIAGRLPDATLELCEGGHIFFMQDPTAWPRIVEFLES